MLSTLCFDTFNADSLNRNSFRYLQQMLSRTFLQIKTSQNFLSNYSQRVLNSQHQKMNKPGMINLMKSCIPPLDGKSHKGQAGRIGIVGGSLEYTGAPYFAGISALKVGADLVHIFCTKAAAGVIKSYSPELIVHPLLDSSNGVTDILPWLERLHAIVIGPGLGREASTFKIVSELIAIIRERHIPLVIDADGLFLITEHPEIIQNFESPVVLTPNKIEFERLNSKIKGPIIVDQLGINVSILKKGMFDELYSNSENFQWHSSIGGSGRRCGGQGDILSGSIAVLLHWALTNIDKIKSDNTLDNVSIASSVSCYAASALVRLCNQKAFEIKGRSMLATDMIEHIHAAFEDLFGA